MGSENVLMSICFDNDGNVVKIRPNYDILEKFTKDKLSDLIDDVMLKLDRYKLSLKKINNLDNFEMDEILKYEDDCLRIQKLLSKYSISKSLVQCQALWVAYSKSRSANWLIVDDYEDKEVFEIMKRQLNEVKK
jgi:hypothetical protein